MQKFAVFFLLSFFFLSGCGMLDNENQSKKVTPAEQLENRLEADSLTDEPSEDFVEIDTFAQAQKVAFGALGFGMGKEQVDTLNPRKQILGKYNYNFTYSFNADNQLYQVRLKSNGINTLYYDDNLKFNYQNLYKILKIKFGEPIFNRGYPSVFDVMNSKKLTLARWEIGIKQINLGLQENGMNSFSVFCEISDEEMKEAERLRVYKVKNKDILEAADKF